MQKILVLGGAGYIGSHTCKLLSLSGYLPIVYDNLSTGNEWSVKWGPLKNKDVRDKNSLKLALQEYTPAAIIHFAASAYVGESVENPAKYYNNNLISMISLLDTMVETGTQNLVFSSSCAVYGKHTNLPITENTHKSPINPYGNTKLMAEQMIQDYANAHDINAVALRYFNACGADQDAEIGEAHSPETHIIPRALMAAAGEIDQLTIFGDKYDTPDGTCVRDYIHVSDLASAHVKALNYLKKNKHLSALNLGIGQGISIRQIIQSVETVTGKKVPHTYSAARVGDPDTLIADNALAKSELNFSPKYTNIDEIISTAWKWYKKQMSHTQGP